MRIWRNLEENKELLKKAEESKRFIVFDTETTGLKTTDEIIEFAGCKCDFMNGEFCVYDVLHIYIKPSISVPEEVVAINGITNEFLDDKMCERDAFRYIREFMGDSPVVGAYNSNFDVRMLSQLYQRCGDTLNVELEVDLLKIARDIFCEQKLKDHKLATIANTYGVDKGIRFHSAIDDVIVLIRVINAMIKDLNENGEVNHSVLKKIRVFKLNYYEGYRGNSILYVITSVGVISYQFKNDVWISKSEAVEISSIDMNDVQRQIFSLSECGDFKQLHKKCKTGIYTNRKKGDEDAS